MKRALVDLGTKSPAAAAAGTASVPETSRGDESRNNKNWSPDSVVHVDQSQRQPKKKRIRKDAKKIDTSSEPALIVSLMRMDPILQFLTRATGKPLVPLTTVKATLPAVDTIPLGHLQELHDLGILQIAGDHHNTVSSWDNEHITIGFPAPPSLGDSHEKSSLQEQGTLHGSTKTAAKRRLAALRRSLKALASKGTAATDDGEVARPDSTSGTETVVANLPTDATKDWVTSLQCDDTDEDAEVIVTDEAKVAQDALCGLFGFSAQLKGAKEEVTTAAKSRLSLTRMLYKQAAYAGSNPSRTSRFAELSETTTIPDILMDALGLERKGISPIISERRKLYTHQARAIDSAFRGKHTLVCTGTGSGKSLCFLVPVLAAAMENQTSLLLFPTKALAQDQLTKLNALLKKHNDLEERIKPGIIDGDTPHATRTHNAKHCNVILTNPDTLHAAILPNWRSTYKHLLGRIKYVVIDEAHMYEGVFGAHVAMVLSRFIRLAAVSSHKLSGCVKIPTFLGCSATMFHPEHHFRLLCPISKDDEINILSSDDDGSPRSAKHFFVWNPPIMDSSGLSQQRVTLPRRKKTSKNKTTTTMAPQSSVMTSKPSAFNDKGQSSAFRESDDLKLVSVPVAASSASSNAAEVFRRHAADETALLLARAVVQGVRCIAFCKTRCLVEWVFARTIEALKSDQATAHLASRVESYRGGYTMEVRRSIESRLFKNDLLAVVGTSALELGVDVGGIDLTLHCGYPSSYASLLQQAGRAGRGTARLEVPSLSVMVCFNSASEQHIWRNPTSLLSRTRSALVSMPINIGLVQGHLLCAGEEYPLTKQHAVSALFSGVGEVQPLSLLSDRALFGSEIFDDSVPGLVNSGMMKIGSTPVAATTATTMSVYKTHPFVDKPWRRVNLRSIEPINYSIVDLSHPLQGGSLDGVKDEKAVLDTIPYSRVFYHAFPGAIVTHRGRKYKIQSMTRPPAVADSCCGYKGASLAAFAKPTSARYHTRPLSTLKITVVKQLERIQDNGRPCGADSSETEVKAHVPDPSEIYNNTSESEGKAITKDALGGNGVVNVLRSVHGYKKLSPITRAELSRTELQLPTMEFDTFAFWLDTEAGALSTTIKGYDEGVHALSHALLAVAPLFVPCSGSDINCDHQTFGCTRIVIFDVRAGGSGTCAQLFKYLFVPDGLLHAAIELMENCEQCHNDRGYEGGCPACIHFGQCLKFNRYLSRTAAILIGRRMLDRIQQTELYTTNEKRLAAEVAETEGAAMGKLPASPQRSSVALNTSPRRNARAKALRNAKEVKPTKEQDIVVGRESWPTDRRGKGGRQVGAD